MFVSVRVDAAGTPDVLVLGVFQPDKGATTLDRASQQAAGRDALDAVNAALARPECTGEFGRFCEAFPAGGAKSPARIIIVGLGKRDGFRAGACRNLAAIIGRRLASTKDQRVAVELAGPLREAKVDAPAAGQAFGEGLGILAFTADQFRGTASKAAGKRTDLRVRSSSAPFARAVERGLALGQSVNVSRMLSITPPNIATPAWIADQAQKMAKGVKGLKVTVMRGKDLERERMEGLLNVGKASENEPCMIRIEYTPAGGAKGAKRAKKPALLVGKTITYDTGGLSLKVNNGMRGMKGDKDGGCAVVGAMHAIATVIKPSRPVVALLVSAENSVSDEAYRPDDILTFRNGVTVEVTNTDAEGRLVLADALCWACEKEDPAYIVDIATLTGGVVTALGSTYAGLFCEDDALRAKVERSSDSCGERVWRLPMHQEYRDMMKSTVADIVNSNPNRKAHPIQGAAFLSYFVQDGVPWCHLDIAGVHVSEGESGPYAKETPTGFGVRLMAGLLEKD